MARIAVQEEDSISSDDSENHGTGYCGLRAHPENRVRKALHGVRHFANRHIYGANQSPKEFLASFFPILPLLTRYKARWVFHDALAGIIVSMVHLPQAMAGAMTAVMKPEHGLYMTMIPALAYVLLGSSPQNSVGGMPITAALAGVSMARIREVYHHDNFTIHSAEEMLDLHFHIAGVVTFIAGILQIFMGFFKLSFLSSALSKNVLDPFSLACCLQAICGQIPNMLGIKLYPYCGLYKHPWLISSMFVNLHQVNAFDALISALSASTILGFREYIQPKLYRRIKLVVPIEFVVLVVATILSYLLDFHGQFGVRIMKKVPTHIPYPKMPSMVYVPHVVLEGFITAIVSFALTLSSAKILARKEGDRISPSQELIALGSSNLLGSFFSCFVSAAPIGRSVINQSMGSKSQLSSLFGCLFMIFLFLTCGQSLKYLPICVVSTNIVVTLLMTLKMFQDVPTIWKSNRLDAVIWVSTFVSCILLDVRIGLLSAVGLSLFSIVYKSQKPKIRVMGRLRDSATFVPVRYFDEAVEVPGVKVLQISSALHYGNAEYLVKRAIMLAFKTNVAPIYTQQTPVEAAQVAPSRLSAVSIKQRRVSFAAKVIQSSSQVFGKQSANIKRTQRSRNMELDSTERRKPRDHRRSSQFFVKFDQSALDESIALFSSINNVVYHVVLDLSMAVFVDSVGVRGLEQLANDLKKVEVELFVVQQKGSLKRQLQLHNVLKVIPETNIFLNVEAAVVEAIKRKGHFTGILSPRHSIQESPDDRFYSEPVFYIEGLPGTNDPTED
ncbi:hypothetical protein RvY_04917 [Ramazzottius varieornatus]|uniref:STAS domain-containing protein n=1 Tax=Ramazzottius varieornatus TaxID=947166 RepID=A0A1D1V351_RAMVA|nr:hypothetical protein RvY_04917 [Ramazzottius varieornatus]